jgi:tRNA pseudouridine13 synthase
VIPGTGGTIKETPEDFLVTEIPLYTACGEGEHLYVEFEKRGITTLEAMRRLARELKVSERDIGYAGLKDSRALTRQTISIPRVEAAAVLALEIPGIKILSAQRHRNKLKLGHLAGNRFALCIRGVEPDALSNALSVLAVLEKRGVPNFFGSQRYGGQGNSHLVGRHLVAGDFEAATAALIGDPAAVRDQQWHDAILAFKDGNLELAASLFPRHCSTERELLQRLQKKPGDYVYAFNGVNPRLRKLFLSAFQSALFDRLLAMRLDHFDRLLPGDIAFKHVNGACFLVEDASIEAPRVEQFEISPTGPMFGVKMMEPGGEAGIQEAGLLASEGLNLKSFDLGGSLRVEGERRPLRVPVSQPVAKKEGDDLYVEFSLPKGAYATSLLCEIMKTGGVP